MFRYLGATKKLTIYDIKNLSNHKGKSEKEGQSSTKQNQLNPIL